MDLKALWLTLRLAGTTTAMLLVVALPLAWWIARGGVVRGRWCRRGGAAAGAAADGAGVLSAGGAGAADRAGAADYAGAGASAGIQFCGARGGVGAV